MSQLVKMKRQGNFKDFKRFEAFKELVEQKKALYSLLLMFATHNTQNFSLMMSYY
jgi:hypothetical protein